MDVVNAMSRQRNAEAKYCAFFIHGEPKYYVCPRTEYCCNFGCCVSPGFQIYHLWYYWLLVIIMFLVCSGGGWWYRYWLQGRYRANTSTPHRSYNSRTQHAFRGPTCQAQQARISYNTARNTVLLHRMWKAGPHARVALPAYHNATAAGSTHYQGTSVVLSDANCPYYQFYRPPPYEEIESHGKIVDPMSQEQSRMMLQNPSPSQCFAHSYNLAASRIGETDGGIMPNGAVGLPVAEIPAHPHHTFAAGTPDLCHAPHCPVNFRFYKRSLKKFATVNEEKASDLEEILRSSPENHVEEKGILRIDCASGSRSSEAAKNEPISGVHGQSSSKARPTRSRSFGFLGKEAERRNKNGSLKFFKGKDERIGYEVVRSEEPSSDASSSQSNPSNNVILASSNSTIDTSAATTSDADERRLLLSSTQGSTNSNLESSRRSRSLD